VQDLPKQYGKNWKGDLGKKNNHTIIFQLQIELHQAKKQQTQTITEWLNFIEKNEMKYDCIDQ
jgi:hypothetical protein